MVIDIKNNIHVLVGLILSGKKKPEDLRIQDIRSYNILNDYLNDIEKALSEEDLDKLQSIRDYIETLDICSLVPYVEERVFAFNSLIIVDCDNRNISPEIIIGLARRNSVILVSHFKKVADKYRKSLEGVQRVSVVLVDHKEKEISDMKIFHIISNAELLNVNSVILISLDRDFETFKRVNNLNFQQVSDIKNLYCGGVGICDYSVLGNMETEDVRNFLINKKEFDIHYEQDVFECFEIEESKSEKESISGEKLHEMIINSDNCLEILKSERKANLIRYTKYLSIKADYKENKKDIISKICEKLNIEGDYYNE